MDKIFINDLRVRAIDGIWEWERRMPQIVSIDLEMGADIRAAAARDQIDATLDYKAVAKRVLGCDGQMWDVEGKEIDTYVVKKLLSFYP